MRPGERFLTAFRIEHIMSHQPESTNAVNDDLPENSTGMVYKKQLQRHHILIDPARFIITYAIISPLPREKKCNNLAAHVIIIMHSTDAFFIFL